jgi:hypothetical protein
LFAARRRKWPNGRFFLARLLQREGNYVSLFCDYFVLYKNAVHRCTIFECACRYILQTCRELWYSRPFFWLCVGDEKTSPKRNFLTRHTTYFSVERLHTLQRNLPAGRRFHSRTFRSGSYQPHLQLMKVASVLLLDMRLSNIAHLLDFE